MYVQERNLALSSEGIKMTVASEQPHFIDILGTGVVIYHLQVSNCCISTLVLLEHYNNGMFLSQEGQTRIGSTSSSPKADIGLCVHCSLVSHFCPSPSPALSFARA